MDFLSERTRRPFSIAASNDMEADGLFLSENEENSLEVGVVLSSSKPNRLELTKVWKDRRGGRATPVLLVVLYDEKACLCGPSGDDPAILEGIDHGQAERLAESALALPDRLSAQRFLHDTIPTLETALPGIKNEGMLAAHNLITTAKNLEGWHEGLQKAKKAAAQSNEKLLSTLGYSVEKLDNLTHVLRSADQRAALAVMLNESESIEAGSKRFNTMSPISYAMSKADEENLSWIIIVKGNRIRLYSNEVGKGVGRRGRTETYIECQPSLLADDDLGYLWMLFSAQALGKGGSLEDLLASSERFAGDLAEKLRDRIYEEVVPHLAKGIVEARAIAKPSREDLDLTYQMALTVLFRLLFIAYAEDRDLLPYRQNEAYRKRSLTEKAKELAKAVAEGTDIGSGHHHWQECNALFSAINIGNSEWSVPTYGGGLFSQDPQISPAGDTLKGLSVLNEHFEMALRALLVTDAEGEPGAVDFRALGVREFGTIYEGLLEAELSAAESDLMLDKKATYVPLVEGKEADVKSGEVYLHNKSGARKSSGSYYTKSFAVEYLLDGALEPALDDHFAKLDAMRSDVDAAETFFDFRVADIAMGSGHFLVAAVDRIEARMANYLKKRQEEKRPLTLVQQDLNDLRNAAQKELGEIQDDFDIEDGQLLRRQIARRCIYGVDLNPLAVQLARLSIWIHTFVPGLPLSLLDHNLVRGNALVGVGTVDEIRDKFDQMGGTLFQVDADNLLGQAAKPLQRLANLKDATPADIDAGRQAMQEARLATLETEALCDLITAQPISEDERVKGFAFEHWEDEKGNIHASRELGQARKDLQGLHAFHFPVQFPEVFLGKNPGFNVILGNPPWQEVTVEEDNFWARYYPGLGGHTQREQEIKKSEFRVTRSELFELFEREKTEAGRIRQVLVARYEGMGTGDPDLYKAFCNRFITLNAKQDGCIGVVLPRSAFSAAGSEKFRRRLLNDFVHLSVNTLKNKGQWVFEDVGEQYTFALLIAHKSDQFENGVCLSGPHFSAEQFAIAKSHVQHVFSKNSVFAWNDTVSFPSLPSEASVDIFAQFKAHPQISTILRNSWRARPDRELDATNNRDLMDLEAVERPDGFFPVYKGKSFNLWTPDTGDYFAWSNPELVLPWLQSKRTKANKSARDSVHKEFTKEYTADQATLPCNRPRIAFRDVTRATDARTVIACLLPAKVFIQNSAPYLLFPKGNNADQAFVLGVLSSIPLDWYARRFVELHLNYFVFNPLPVPRPVKDDPLWQRTVQLSGRLACPDERFKEWADEVGVEWGPLDEDVKQDMIHELDAVVAHLYGLSADQLTHIFETFHEGWDYLPRLTEVMRHYEDWKNKK